MIHPHINTRVCMFVYGLSSRFSLFCFFVTVVVVAATGISTRMDEKEIFITLVLNIHHELHPRGRIEYENKNKINAICWWEFFPTLNFHHQELIFLHPFLLFFTSKEVVKNLTLHMTLSVVLFTIRTIIQKKNGSIHKKITYAIYFYCSLPFQTLAKNIAVTFMNAI